MKRILFLAAASVAFTVGSEDVNAQQRLPLSSANISNCNASALPEGTYKGNTVSPKGNGQPGLSCVAVDNTTKLSMSYCMVYSSKPGPSNGGSIMYDERGDVAYVGSQYLSISYEGNKQILCWSFKNNADHERDFTLYVK